MFSINLYIVLVLAILSEAANSSTRQSFIYLQSHLPQESKSPLVDDQNNLLTKGLLPFQDILASLTCEKGKHHLKGQPYAQLLVLLSRSFRRYIPRLRKNAPNPAGLTLDPCQKNSDCIGIRYCLNLNLFPNAPLCSDGDNCVCLPPLPNICNLNSQCETGEVCVYYRNATTPFCVSAYVETTNPSFRDVPSNPAPSPVPSPTSGLTWDYCQRQSECLGDRVCTYLNINLGSQENQSPMESCESRDPCICVPPVPIHCASKHDCPVGESCAELDLQDTCVSTTIITYIPRLSFVDDPDEITFLGTGLTLDGCASVEGCQQDRKCYTFPPSERVPCPSTVFANCRCYPLDPAACIDNSICQEGEVCAFESSTKERTCVSQVAIVDMPSLILQDNLESSLEAVPSAELPIEGNSAVGSGTASEASNTAAVTQSTKPVPSTPTPSPLQGSEATSSASAVCIDADALQHLGQTNLVYKTNVLAKVICDVEKSCATPGHMVMYQGRGMMMKTYCEFVGCVERVMYVNSPRRKLGMRVKSRTIDLEFSAFAARYTTVLEEMALSAVLRIGL